MRVGNWAQRWMELRLSLKNLDPSLLMWDMRRSLNVKLLPDRGRTIQFLYSELEGAQKSWWLVVEGGTVDFMQFRSRLRARSPGEKLVAIDDGDLDGADDDHQGDRQRAVGNRG